MLLVKAPIKPPAPPPPPSPPSPEFWPTAVEFVSAMDMLTCNDKDQSEKIAEFAAHPARALL
jgi:hypothetical protein